MNRQPTTNFWADVLAFICAAGVVALLIWYAPELLAAVLVLGK